MLKINKKRYRSRNKPRYKIAKEPTAQTTSNVNLSQMERFASFIPENMITPMIALLSPLKSAYTTSGKEVSKCLIPIPKLNIPRAPGRLIRSDQENITTYFHISRTNTAGSIPLLTTIIEYRRPVLAEPGVPALRAFISLVHERSAQIVPDTNA